MARAKYEVGKQRVLRMRNTYIRTIILACIIFALFNFIRVRTRTVTLAVCVNCTLARTLWERDSSIVRSNSHTWIIIFIFLYMEIAEFRSSCLFIYFSNCDRMCLPWGDLQRDCDFYFAYWWQGCIYCRKWYTHKLLVLEYVQHSYDSQYVHTYSFNIIYPQHLKGAVGLWHQIPRNEVVIHLRSHFSILALRLHSKRGIQKHTITSIDSTKSSSQCNRRI